MLLPELTVEVFKGPGTAVRNVGKPLLNCPKLCPLPFSCSGEISYSQEGQRYS